MTVSTYKSIIALNVNGQNALMKRYRMIEWIKKIRPIYILPTKDPYHI